VLSERGSRLGEKVSPKREITKNIGVLLAS